ncbi:transmembrane protein KIAA1109 homolog isoform X4 [Tribolium madens]|uniref:transmembrane protein KIAA1109 homolog isoform X4 n=1 Tax=Tribolium madens TaxID=41895 RepID=UPI001CF7665E|nr:transmembrane protein KIAA1109 homolog isoform X4 [Tribolium madens]
MESDPFINSTIDEPETSKWNANSSTFGNLDDIKMDSNFAMLLCSLLFAVGWVIYITYYNSRLVAFIITKIMNRFFISEGYFKIGSLSLNALSGKIMFRDVVYITYDYTIRVQDGYLIFRWWRSYVPKDVSEDLSHSDTRLSVMLNGFELHVYNRSQLYSNLERIFGIGPNIIPNYDNKTTENLTNSESHIDSRKQRPEAAMARTWRDLIPVIKIDVSSSRLVFGNRLVPTTLSITFEESHFVYSTKPAVCTLDRFMHFVKSKAENVRVMLAPSLKYTGMLDEPPRYMGEGFVLMSTNDLELYFYMDEPGQVPEEPVLVTLANGDIVESSPPQWGVDIKCGKGTDFSYGPWADRQREHLFKFFYPQDYLPMEVTKMPKPGEKRQMQSFDVRLLMQNDATIDILFTKDKETNAVHINVGAGSYLEVTLPWITLQDGYATKITGQLLHLEATTSLQFRDFIESETLEFCLLCHYPLVWNDHQLWEINLTGCKATVKLIFTHKWFFQDLINDWASKQIPDLMHFVPYTWRFGLTLKHCELITLVNQYNWIDCSSVGQKNRLENTQLALCAHFLHMSFDLPFDEFLPETVPLNFSIQGESIDLSLFIPEFHTSRNVVQALEKYAKVLSKDGSTTKKAEIIPKWRNECQSSCGWVDLWWVPIGAINIVYTYHPCPPIGTTPQADISTPVKEEILLSPMRFPHHRKNRKRSPEGVQKFDPTSLKADTVSVELEIGPSVLLLYGTALKNFMNFKENIFGEDQSFTDMQQSNSGENPNGDLKSDDSSANIPLELREDFDHRNYRPLEVDVSIIAHDVQAHLLKNCTEKDPPCPIILIERVGFEMKKRYDQTELQLLVSPSVLLVSDNINRVAKDKHLNQGKLTLSSLQVRGHAMFSNVGQSLDQDTIEYAWLVEVQMGKLSGKLTSPQLYSVLATLETLILLLMDTENELNSPKEDALLTRPVTTKKSTVSSQNVHVQQMQQAIQQLLQPKSNASNKNTILKNNKKKIDEDKKGSVRSTIIEENSLDNQNAHKLKYKLCRVAVDAVDFWLVESGVALQLWVSPIRLANCNLHGKQVSSGLSCIVYSMSVRQMVWQTQKYNHNKSNSDTMDLWLEVGAVNFGPLIVESAISSDIKEQNLHQMQQKFLRTHDERWKKLWFLWPELNKTSGKCGCTGGCTFFGTNKNGTRFFKPSRKDLEDGINVAAFRVNEPGKDPGYGQSILHENMLIFRTPPYIVQEISLQDTLTRSKSHSPRIGESEIKISPVATTEREHKVNRRFSSTSMMKEVPYSRLVETCPILPSKLDSDSKLHTEVGKLSVTKEPEPLPKNSISDSKLAVDYFNAPVIDNNNATKPSESHHSLGERISLDEKLAQEVQRTTSMSSENQSEAFFSADEDIINSRSSSLRNSILLTRQDSNSVPPQRKKFSSELSIVADRPYRTIGPIHAPSSAPEGSTRLRLASHRSDHEIHTPEHRSITTNGLVTPQRLPNVRTLTETDDLNDSLGDSSDSYSSTSYVSAVGSQEDFTLVDLHMQVNRLIIDSPMLMSCYVTHLTQCKCKNWGDQSKHSDQFSVPLFEKNEEGKLVYVGARFVPCMETASEGITSLKMVSRGEGNKTPTSPYAHVWDQDEVEGDSTFQEEELLSNQMDAGCRTIVIVKLKGDLDVMVSPLLLESLQRFVDALTPIVANLHPLTVINHLHTSCVGQVESANILKTTENIAKLCQTPTAGDEGPITEGIFEETVKTQLQAAIFLPKVNVTLLQVSIVEEIISFSALDNMKDLTCVSLFSVCFDNVTAKLHCDKQAREVLQRFHRPAVVQTGSKKGANRAKILLGLQSNTNADIIQGEPVFIESCEKQQQQLVVCLNVGKAHAQLRRLRNESSILDDAIITAIPNYKSKVLFTPAKVGPQYRGLEYYLQPSQSDNNIVQSDDTSEDKLGFIMFECGLEGVSLKVVKKSQFEHVECKFNVKDATESMKSDEADAEPKPETPKSRDGGEGDTELDNSNESKDNTVMARDSGNVSSCIIELKVVWFNFAAPPRAPITRKIDYTRLDWNLLSTASPAINAWMNPSNRLAIRVVHMVRSMYRRSTAVVACLMTEALETQKVHMLAKSRYDKLTPLAQTLHEDPSLQLCSILQQYYLECDPLVIEANLRESELPQLFTLRQGVVVLSRQWKNILYTPLLPQHTVKTRIKPLNVTISVPEVEEICHDLDVVDVEENHGEVSGNEDHDITDEHARLLHSGIILKPHRNVGEAIRASYLDMPQVAVVSGGVESVLTSPSPTVQHRKRKKSLQPTQHPNSSRASVVLPLLTNNTFGQKCDDNICYGTLREDCLIYNMGSDPSDVYSHSSPELPSSPLHRTAYTHSSEDLYSWMAKQDTVGTLKGYMESKIDTLQTESSGDAGTLPKPSATAPEISLYPIHDSVRLLDANQIFQPLLLGLGVMPQQLRFTTMSDSSAGNDVTTLDALGSNFSLVGNMETMHIDIVVSEHGKTEKKKGKNKNESPAFVCEKVSVELEIDRMTDMAVNEMMRTKNVLYISRGQLKNHTSTVINFTIGVRYISQRVNMPLLRLLHQITNMYQNVKDTQNELREQQPVEIRRPKTSSSDHADIKHHSSISDIQEPLIDTKQLSLKISNGSCTSQNKPIVSPSPSLRSRPQSFAQKLRSTGKSVKGYVNLNEGGGTPITMSSPSGSALDHMTVSSDKSTGRCWKTIYHLLELYANMPDTKTIKHRFSVGTYDISEHYKGNRKYDLLTEMKSSDDLDKNESTPPPIQNKVTKEHTKLVVFGVARIHRTRLLATLSGLKLEAEITSLHSSLTCRKKSIPAMLECSLTGQIGRTMINLFEGVSPNQQTVVKVTIGKSQTLYSSIMKRGKDKNSGLLTIGAVNIDIPQHPVALHGMVTRGSKQLSSTLQELRVSRTSSRLSRGVQVDDDQQSSPSHQTQNVPVSSFAKSATEEKSLLQPLVMQFSVILQSLSITAALLPSLQATYKMDKVNSAGFTGSRAKFTIDLPHHSLSFNTVLQGHYEKVEANLPSEASIALPAVHVSAEYIPENATNIHKNPDGVVFRQGGYLNAHADIGVFEHSLTTDLLNHLVFVQKVFMKEVNEVVQKVYGGERPVPIWLEDTEETSSLNRFLFSLVIRISRIQLTATTAGSSAVRLETGAVVFELSNRVQNVSGSTQSSATARLFGKAQVDLNLSLGQIIRNAVFEEAEIEYQPVAFFNTRIGLRNAFQDEIVEGEDKEVVLITLKRPLIYIQPVAIDKAILVWLNYKNAYDYWNEKRANLNKEVLTATQQVYEKFQFGQFTSQLSAPHLGTLFLQLTVEDMGICLPLNPLPFTWNQRNVYEESRGAVVVTLENTSISACSSGSLVSKGKFSNLCLRFADDFETSLDDWKPDMSDSSIMNLCVVSDGTYEVCSRTIAAKQPNENAKWFLNVQWQMEGVDIHLDTGVGKQLSALGHTLTMLTGAEEAQLPMDYDSDDNEPIDGTRVSQESILPSFMFDPNLDNRSRSKLMEKEMNEQAKIINDLRTLGASHGTIELEMKRLHELETIVYKGFRRDMIQKLRRQSIKAQSIKGKFGLGSKSTFRSKSFMAQSPTLERKDSPDKAPVNTGSYESSPRSGPSRSASLRVRNPELGPKVTFSDTRQASLPSASSETHLDWPEYLDIDGEKILLRKKGIDDFVPFPGTVSQATVPMKAQEPNVDLELDVKVFINSGKCVLHTKDPVKEEEIKLNRMRKDRSCSAGLLEFPPSTSSPDPIRRNKDKLLGQSSASRLRPTQHATLVDLTIFHIPGMDVKLHYTSKVVCEDDSVQSPDFEKAFKSPMCFDELEESRIDKAFKRVESQPIKVSTSMHGITNPNYGCSPTSSLDDLQFGGTSPLDTARGAMMGHRRPGVKKASLFVWMTLQSVPEETIISPHILEFLEQTLEPIPPKTNFNTTDTSFLPSDQDLTNYGTYVYASFPVDVIVYFHMQPSTFRFSCLPVSRVECMLQLPSLDIVFSSKRAEDELSEFGDGAPNPAATAVGGLSVTGCLSDFSVYVFHPYGGKKSALKEAQWSPLSDSERKDSLSINVEFVKFHLSRSRMLNFKQEGTSKGKGGDHSRAVIRFSTIIDIGSASFKYDMRRLTEILAFPKAWYRRSIVRRMFLGDLSMSAVYSEEDDSITSQGSPNTMKNSHETRKSDKSPLLNNKDRLKLSLDSDVLRHNKLKELGRAFSGDSGKETPSPSEFKNLTAWETLVLFVFNFKKLNVHMNMGNVMGNVSWMTKDFRSDGRLSIGSTGHKNLYIALGLGGSSLDAKGGIVGGNIEIANIDTYVHIREEPEVEPDHTVGLRLHALELRLDYMATSVLMCRVSDLNVNLRDEWKLSRATSRDSIPTRRPATIFMHGNLTWDQLQVMISKSTTADLLKMFNKLEEFFSQQFNSSKRAFSGFAGSSRPARVTPQKSREFPTTATNTTDARHHRHWQKVMAQVAGLQLSTMDVPLPQFGTVLGGTMELHGNNISLACFHGINFKSKSWALFSLREPSITFNTEGQEIPSNTEGAPPPDVHVVQTLTCSLGLSTYKTHLSMATVCKVSRSVIFPPQFKTLQEWFHYAFANSQIDEVDKFPSLEREKCDGNNSMERGRNSTKLADPNHNREVIFAVPSLQLHLKTEHLQSATVPDISGEKPTVECSFITEFEDHIFVTVDAEAFFFLHDLITSYVKEKEKVLGFGEKRSSVDLQDKGKLSEGQAKKGSIDVDIFAKDWRNYNCKTWHLEPTVRLLSVAGKYIEPYGIDYILQKLGFSHARTTIPKWMQRGFMDPLDAILAVLTLRMVQVVKGDGNKTDKETKAVKDKN